MLPSERLATKGWQLPEPVTPIGSYLSAKRVGPHVFTSGQLPIGVDGELVTGRLGAGVDVAAGQQAARTAALNAIAAAAAVAGHVDELQGVVRMVVYVNSDPGFTEQPAVANGASELLTAIFGDAGRHVRSAVGVGALPKNAAVEVELVFEA